MLQVNTYSPGVVSVTESPPLRGSVVNGMFAAPVGNTRLDRVWTVFEAPEKFTRTPGVATASERVPAISTPVSNHRPGLSVIVKLTSLLSPRTAFDTARMASPLTNTHRRIDLRFLARFVIANAPCFERDAAPSFDALPLVATARPALDSISGRALRCVLRER